MTLTYCRLSNVAQKIYSPSASSAYNTNILLLFLEPTKQKTKRKTCRACLF